MSEHVLDKPATGIQPSTATRFAGAITYLNGDVLQGWAVDTTEVDQRLVIEICIDDACVALVRADQFEPQATVGDQFHGFVIQLRQAWLDQARHVSARVANQRFTLSDDFYLPIPVSSKPAPIASQVWHTGGLRISGWALDPQAPRRQVQVTVREGRSILAEASCNINHQAFADRATSDHAFEVDLPWSLADGKTHILDIENDLGQPLAGSPITICCMPEGLERILERLSTEDDTHIFDIAIAVAKEQTLRLPKSAGWSLYPQWFDAFKHIMEDQIVNFSSRAGLLILSEGDEYLEDISLRSLSSSNAQPHCIATCPSGDVKAAVEKLLLSGCDSIVPIIAGDRLGGNALDHLSALVADGDGWGYADCDRETHDEKQSLPWFKPAWDIDVFIGLDLYRFGAVYSSAIISKALALLETNDVNVKIHWHLLSASIVVSGEKSQVKVRHLPYVLYHRNYQSHASPEQAAPCAARQAAISWLCQQLCKNTTVTVVPEYPALLRAHWPLPVSLPKVSLIVPTRDQVSLLKTCIDGLLNNTDYSNLEIIVVDNNSTDQDTLDYFKTITKLGITVIPYPYPFNYSDINNYAVKYATGEIIGLVNNDIEIIKNGWLLEMVSQILRPGVGAVGAKLLWPNGMVQHGGVVVGVNGLAAHSGNTWTQQDPGYLGNNQITRRQSAVTAACLLTKASVYLAMDGLDGKAFPVAFNDVDLCLRIRESGLDIIWTPFAELIHAESASRGKDTTPEKRARALREQKNFITRWFTYDHSDPYYHPALSLDYLSGPYGGLAFPPRIRVVRTNSAGRMLKT